MSVRLVETGQRLAGLEVLRAARARILNYTQAENAARVLATRLTELLDRSWLDACQLVPLPRGGLFVAGFLAYYLHLQTHQVGKHGSAGPSDKRVLLVDDCALSGTRLTRGLRDLTSREIVFATLFSPRELREAVCASEPRIGRFESAHDLVDLAPENFPDCQEREQWRKRWRTRRPDAYWIGLPEVAAFPWGEPDHPVWNQETESLEDGWRLAPPDQCLKNWGCLKLKPSDAVRRLASARGVAFNLHNDSVLLCRLEDGMVFELEGVAADMWKGLAAYGDPETVERFLQSRYEIDRNRLHQDLEGFVRELTRQRLLS